MPRTFENLITTREVSIAIEQLLVAPEGTAWTPGRVNLNSIPSGFMHLGAVAEDTPQLAITRERFQLRAGIPQVLQYQAVRGVGGTFSMSFHAISNFIARYAAGNYAPTKIISNSPFTAANTIISVAPSSRVLVEVGTVQINTMQLIAGDIISFGNDIVGLATGENEAEVAVVNATTPGWVQLTTPGATGAIPVAGTTRWVKVLATRLAAGTSRISTFRLLGVADFIDGQQIVHDMQKAQPSGEWTDQIRPDQNLIIPASFDLLGYPVAAYGNSPGATSELVVAERWYFGKNM